MSSQATRERWTLLISLDRMLETPMNVLAFVWLSLTVLDLAKGLTEIGTFFFYLIWVLFILHFALELALAPKKLLYIRKKWLTALSLLVPALRIIRVFRLVHYLRLLRSGSVIRVISSINRSVAALKSRLGKRGLIYVFSVTILVVFAGAAGIMYLEKEYSDYFNEFSTAIWWTSMMITTMGSDYFPKSPEGRVLGLLLAVYGFAIFGYVTAAVASLFIEQDSSKIDELKELRKEIQELKQLCHNQR